MTTRSFGITDLVRILTEAAGGGDGLDFVDDALDAEFQELGYDSLAMLETAARIEREFNITLDDSTVADAMTPRVLIELVNRYLTLEEAS